MTDNQSTPPVPGVTTHDGYIVRAAITTSGRDTAWFIAAQAGESWSTWRAELDSAEQLAWSRPVYHDSPDQDNRAAALADLTTRADIRSAPAPQQQAGIEHVLAAVAGTVFTSAAGETVILLRDGPYVIRVDQDGDTSSAYLVTVPPAEIAEAIDADAAEIGGWSTGWDC